MISIDYFGKYLLAGPSKEVVWWRWNMRERKCCSGSRNTHQLSTRGLNLILRAARHRAGTCIGMCGNSPDLTQGLLLFMELSELRGCWRKLQVTAAQNISMVAPCKSQCWPLRFHIYVNTSYSLSPFEINKKYTLIWIQSLVLCNYDVLLLTGTGKGWGVEGWCWLLTEVSQCAVWDMTKPVFRNAEGSLEIKLIIFEYSGI